MRLIDADVLLEILEDKTHKLYEFAQGVLERTGMRSQEHTNAYRELCDWVFFESMVEEQPTVEERPKGEWKRVVDKSNLYVWECNKCKWQQRFWTNYCPDCGNFMEDKEGEVSHE